ncbi:helix-turn-helix domain-containing protein [Avibacterium sp. 21-586]|uniref:helix-turn-helix domain-containing protein n=1 Tax=Avibacterium sp. 21-586 TaxID=2911534 RepID=UPI00224766C5|nr:helix-turn-helix transcriptional regulator [Avibacterium sp. 21-586]MCW9710930.1 helix-turn-helix domain-containing protein [Avibacterium sp. 21-586]
MKKLRTSIHAEEQLFLRQLFIAQRQALGLSQRALAERLGVIYSLIGKIETGDRRLDIIEFIEYCQALELQPSKVLQKIQQQFFQINEKSD